MQGRLRVPQPNDSGTQARECREHAGEEASVDAAVLAIFNAVVRLEEAKARMSVDIRDALGLEGT